MSTLNKTDREAYEILARERRFRHDTINLVPSDNHPSKAVNEAFKYPLFYSENDGKNYYYPGCEIVDEAEKLCERRALQAFPGAEHTNVKPNDGTRANEAAYLAVLKDGETIMSLDLSCGGHLSHGLKWNYSGIRYKIVSYGVDAAGRLDYDKIREIAKKERPKLIIAGGSSFSLTFRFDQFAEIAKEVGALLHADISHFAGLVAAGLYPSPFPHVDLCMTTTQKTLRGPKGALLFSKKEHAKPLNRAVFPGIMAHSTGAQLLGKAICLGEVLTDSFKEEMRRVKDNSAYLCGLFKDAGYKIISDGTETHLFVIDLRPKQMEGRDAQARLQAINILANKQVIPYDEKPPVVSSGLRIGTPCASARGMGRPQMDVIFRVVHECLNSSGERPDLKQKVAELGREFPVPDMELDR